MSNIYSVPLEQGAPVLRPATAPAAGTNYIYTVGNHVRLQLLGIVFKFATDATATSRYFSMTCDDGTNIFFRRSHVATQGASLTIEWQLDIGLGDLVTTTSGNPHISLPDNLILLPNWHINLIFSNQGVGDVFSEIVLHFHKWIERNV